jgi:hypothetical protein
MPKLGDLGGSVNVLREMRNQLVERDRRREIEDERWGSFGKTAEKIACACESRDLESLVTAARELKNRLRRPAVRKELARLESEDEPGEDERKSKIPAKKDKNPTGACKCASCGKVIDGSKEPCIEDAMCTDCALKNKVVSKDKQKKKKVVVPPADTGMGGGGGGGGGSDRGSQRDVGGDGDEKKEGRSILRRRGYLG